MFLEVDAVCTGSGSGWRLVRWVPPGDKWHSAVDQLRGTEEYGDPADTNEAFSIKFHQDDFDQFLFSTGDCVKWLIASNDKILRIFDLEQPSEPIVKFEGHTSGIKQVCRTIHPVLLGGFL